MRLTELLIKGAKVAVHVSPDGEFTAEIAGKTYRGTTLEALKGKVSAATRASRVKVSVPYVRLRSARYGFGSKFVTGVATGRHASSGNLLVNDADAKPEQHSGGYRVTSEFFAADAPVETMRALLAAKAAADDKWQDAVQKHRLDLGAEVDKAIASVTKRTEESA